MPGEVCISGSVRQLRFTRPAAPGNRVFYPFFLIICFSIHFDAVILIPNLHHIFLTVFEKNRRKGHRLPEISHRKSAGRCNN